ncbi:Fic family protein [Gordonia sp. DT219]|uniref:Fic family protein n=1 Tax=Gordonia sp. DT219 TaxID=3416658 RepID=UPI003CF31066
MGRRHPHLPHVQRRHPVRRTTPNSRLPRRRRQPHIADTDWDRLDHGGIAVEAATTYAYLNTAHPWREGNGRSSKLFMRQLLRDHGHDLDFGKITPQQWNNSSALTMPDRGTFEPVPDLLIPVFTRIITTHTPPATNATQAAAVGPLSLGPTTSRPHAHRTATTGQRPYCRPPQPNQNPSSRRNRGPTP